MTRDRRRTEDVELGHTDACSSRRAFLGGRTVSPGAASKRCRLPRTRTGCSCRGWAMRLGGKTPRTPERPTRRCPPSLRATRLMFASDSSSPGLFGLEQRSPRPGSGIEMKYVAEACAIGLRDGRDVDSPSKDGSCPLPSPIRNPPERRFDHVTLPGRSILVCRRPVGVVRRSSQLLGGSLAGRPVRWPSRSGTCTSRRRARGWIWLSIDHPSVGT